MPKPELLSREERPQKPSSDFPLFVHPLGYWSKKRGGVIQHYGRWGKIVKGKQIILDNQEHRAKQALANYQAGLRPFTTAVTQFNFAKLKDRVVSDIIEYWIPVVDKHSIPKIGPVVYALTIDATVVYVGSTSKTLHQRWVVDSHAFKRLLKLPTAKLLYWTRDMEGMAFSEDSVPRLRFEQFVIALLSPELNKTFNTKGTWGR